MVGFGENIFTRALLPEVDIFTRALLPKNFLPKGVEIVGGESVINGAYPV